MDIYIYIYIYIYPNAALSTRSAEHAFRKGRTRVQPPLGFLYTTLVGGVQIRFSESWYWRP